MTGGAAVMMRVESGRNPQALVANKGYEERSAQRRRGDEGEENRTGRAMRQELQIETHFRSMDGEERIDIQTSPSTLSLPIDYQGLTGTDIINIHIILIIIIEVDKKKKRK